MGEGRGSANQVVVLGIALLCFLAITQPTLAAYYNVGGAGGWTFNVVSWPTRKTFRSGDVLVFKYNKYVHDVVPVGKAGYGTCTAPKRGRVYRSGSDKLRLKKGINYFICSVPGHCKSGMKIAVKAL